MTELEKHDNDKKDDIEKNNLLVFYRIRMFAKTES